MDADAVEIRVLGSLIEKQRTTPEQYALSLNALRLACHQSTNREPVADYDEQTIRAALERLSRRGWVRLASGPGSRAVKYRQLFDEAVRLSDPEISLLALLMLRGPQTLGELKARSERLHRFDSLEDVAQTLEALIARELVERLPRRPGQKEERYAQLLGGGGFAAHTSSPEPADESGTGELERRVAQLEEEVAALREAVAGLRRM